MLKCLLGNVNGTLGTNYSVINTVVLPSPLGWRAEGRHFNELPQVLVGLLQPELNKLRDITQETEKESAGQLIYPCNNGGIEIDFFL